MTGNTALLIIDVQMGMYEESNPVYRGEALLETIGGLIAQARAADVPVIYVQHDGSEGHPLHPDAPVWPIHPAIHDGNQIHRPRCLTGAAVHAESGLALRLAGHAEEDSLVEGEQDASIRALGG